MSTVELCKLAITVSESLAKSSGVKRFEFFNDGNQQIIVHILYTRNGRTNIDITHMTDKSFANAKTVNKNFFNNSLHEFATVVAEFIETTPFKVSFDNMHVRQLYV